MKYVIFSKYFRPLGIGSRRAKDVKNRQQSEFQNYRNTDISLFLSDSRLYMVYLGQEVAKIVGKMPNKMFDRKLKRQNGTEKGRNSGPSIAPHLLRGQ